MRSNSMAKKLQHNNVYEFWKEVKVLNNSKVPLPISIDGVAPWLNMKLTMFHIQVHLNKLECRGKVHLFQ